MITGVLPKSAEQEMKVWEIRSLPIQARTKEEALYKFILSFGEAAVNVSDRTEKGVNLRSVFEVITRAVCIADKPKMTIDEYLALHAGDIHPEAAKEEE